MKLNSGDSITSSIVSFAAETLSQSSPLPARHHWLESDLEKTLKLAADRHPHVAEAFRNFTVPIPDWWPGAGRVDLVVEPNGTSNQFDLYELKWCNDDKIEESLWDAVKLLNAHQIDRVRSTYLVYAAKAIIWAKNPTGHQLFESSTDSIKRVLETYSDRWQRVLRGGKGRPVKCRGGVEIVELPTCSVKVAEDRFLIRTARIAPVNGSRFFDPSLIGVDSN